MKIQQLLFDEKPCRVISLRNVTKLHENVELQSQNNLI